MEALDRVCMGCMARGNSAEVDAAGGGICGALRQGATVGTIVAAGGLMGRFCDCECLGGTE